MRLNYATATVAVVLTACGGAALAAHVGASRVERPATATPFATPAPPDGTDTGLKAGVGVICNTSQQAEHFVSLRARGARIPAAMDSVNKESKDPKACGMAAIAYKRGKTMDTKRLHGKTVDIVRVHVLAGYDGHGWMRMRQVMTQYAIVQSKSIEI